VVYEFRILIIQLFHRYHYHSKLNYEYRILFNATNLNPNSKQNIVFTSLPTKNLQFFIAANITVQLRMN
jgi:hypothetical protein